MLIFVVALKDNSYIAAVLIYYETYKKPVLHFIGFLI